MESQVAPRRGAPQRRDRAAATVGPAQRRVMRGQHLPYLVRPPGLVPRLHRDPERGPAQGGRRRPELRQAGVQRARVGLQRRRQLEQDRPELGPQPGRRAEQPGHRLSRVAQPAHVGQVPAGLDRHDEVARGPLPPGGERLPRRQPVEAVVVLHRQVAGGVVLEPQALGHALRIQPAPPVAVLPARRPDQHRHRRYLPAGAGSTQGSARPPSLVVPAAGPPGYPAYVSGSAASALEASEPVSAEPTEDGGAFRIQAVDRAVLLLKSVAASVTPPTVLELARACGINRSTAWRLLRTLGDRGLIDRDPVTQRYTIGYGAITIAVAVTDDTLVRRVRPLLDDLCA